MKAAIRISISGGVGTLVVVLLTGVVIPRLGGPRLFAGETSQLCRELLAEVVRGEALSVRDTAVQRSLAGKREVVRDLADGKLTLAEAAERFRSLNALLDDGQDDILGSYNLAEGDGQDVFENIICWVEMYLRDRPRKCARVVRRLRREWEQHVAGKAKRAF